MSEDKTIHTVSTLADSLSDSGVTSGQILLVHSSMSKIGGWICGGAEAVILALLQVLGENGTLVMPTHNTDNTDPERWQNPPVPQEWWDIIRRETPAYKPATTPSKLMGILPETLRCWPGALRSNHPIGSFTALGKRAAEITADQPLEPMFGDPSPIGRLYELDAHILLLGVPYSNCTSIHLAEYRADYPGKRMQTEACAMLVNGARHWVEFEMLGPDSDDFDVIGMAYEKTVPDNVRIGAVGKARTRLLRQRALVDFAVDWMSYHRGR